MVKLFEFPRDEFICAVNWCESGPYLAVGNAKGEVHVSGGGGGGGKWTLYLRSPHQPTHHLPSPPPHRFGTWSRRSTCALSLVTAPGWEPSPGPPPPSARAARTGGSYTTTSGRAPQCDSWRYTGRKCVGSSGALTAASWHQGGTTTRWGPRGLGGWERYIRTSADVVSIEAPISETV